MFPARESCADRERLFGEFKLANQRLVQIHQTEIEALLIEDTVTFEDLQVQLVGARKHRDATAEALQRHMREHGC